MTDLREHMLDTVSHHHADLGTLTARARTQGTSLRRRRRVAVAGSSVAVLALLGTVGVAGSGLFTGDEGADRSSVAGRGSGGPPTASVEQPPADNTVSATGRTTVAALYAAVTDVVAGKGSDFAGQGPFKGMPDTYGELAFSPADGSGDGQVGVNVQPASILDDEERGLSAQEGFVCLDWMEACKVTDLPDGSRLRTYAEHTAAVGGGTGERLVAERLTRDLRVVASATNGFELPANHWDITRPDAVLSTDQLATVVSQPWWGFHLPAEYAGERDVPSYTEIGGDIALTSTEDAEVAPEGAATPSLKP